MSLALVITLAACGSDDSAGPGAAATSGDPPPPVVCAEGFEPAASGSGCLEIAAESCPPGTRPAIGVRDCVPVGWQSCPEGMQVDASGWGCAPILPLSPCTGATLERIGSSACQPIGDCDAPFPPADADILVDAAFSEAELDDTHFATIGAALAAAPDGAVIAVESGTYPESLNVTRAVSVIGRCAAEVEITDPGDARPGVESDADAVLLRGLTIRGHAGGVKVFGGTARVEECRLLENEAVGAGAQGGDLVVVRSTMTDAVASGGYGIGAFALQSGRIELVDSVVARAKQLAVGVAMGATAKLTRTVVRDSEPLVAGEAARALQTDTGSTLEVEDSALLDNGGGIAVGGEGSSATVARTVVRGGESAAILVRQGGRLDLVDSTLAEAADWQLYASEASAVTVTRSVLRGAAGKGPQRTGGALLETGAVVTVEDVAIVDNLGMGLQVQGAGTDVTVLRSLVMGSRASGGISDGFGLAVGFGGALLAEDVAVLGNEIAGVVVFGSDTDGSLATATATALLVRDTAPSATFGFGRGIDISEGATLVLGRSAIANSVEMGVAIAYGSAAEISDSVIRSSLPSAQGAADGVVVVDATLHLSRSTVRDHGRIGVVVSAAGGFLDAVDVATNVIGIHAQDGTMLTDVASLPATANPLEVLVTSSTRFVDNQTRVGSGQIAIPAPLAPTSD